MVPLRNGYIIILSYRARFNDVVNRFHYYNVTDWEVKQLEYIYWRGPVYTCNICIARFSHIFIAAAAACELLSIYTYTAVAIFLCALQKCTYNLSQNNDL